jgi:hypothetical protein
LGYFETVGIVMREVFRLRLLDAVVPEVSIRAT